MICVKHDLWTYGRHDEEWTRLLKDGPSADARLFVDYFLVRLPAKQYGEQPRVAQCALSRPPFRALHFAPTPGEHPGPSGPLTPDPPTPDP